MILVLDNYDSFVHNVARLLREAGGGPVTVVRSDALTVEELLSLEPSHLVVSPGPGGPSSAGISVPAIRRLAGRCPVLGVCLGHQAVATAFGARVVRARLPLHGSASPVYHEGRGILEGLPRPFLAGRYHSLVVDPDSVPEELEVMARSEEGEIMAIGHRERPVWGVQFHPESILTPEGPMLFRRFLALSEGERGNGARAPSAAAAPPAGSLLRGLPARV